MRTSSSAGANMQGCKQPEASSVCAALHASYTEPVARGFVHPNMHVGSSHCSTKATTSVPVFLPHTCTTPRSRQHALTAPGNAGDRSCTGARCEGGRGQRWKSCESVTVGR
jgi:hypothetical protein